MTCNVVGTVRQLAGRVVADAHMAEGVLTDIVPGLARGAAASALAPLRRRRVPGSVERTTFDPFDRSTAAQPHEAYDRLLAGHPVAYNPALDLWVLSHHSAVRAALRAPAALSSASGVTRHELPFPTMLTTDPPRHEQLRRIGQGAFTKSALAEWTGVADGLATELVDAARSAPGDLVTSIAVPMPTRMIAHILGVPPSDFSRFRRWTSTMIGIVDIEPTLRGAVELGRCVAAGRRFHDYTARRIAEGDLPEGSAIARAQAASEDGTFTPRDAFYFSLLLLLAGNETTTNLIGTLLLSLARHPDQFEALLADPGLISSAIDEGLRHASPVQGFYRKAVSDYGVEGVTIPAGSRVLLLFGAANRDPRAFDDPHRFDITRNATGHLAFGHGIHHCLGAQLARLETAAVLRALLDRRLTIALDGGEVWTRNSSLRGLASLPGHLVDH